MSEEHLVLPASPKRAERIAIPTWLVYVVVFAAGLGISAFVGYAAASSAMNARVSVLEAEKVDIQRRLTSIETKVDQLLQRSPR